MSLQTVKGSTQDGTGGTPVAAIKNEVVSGPTIQAVSPVGSKTTWSETLRTGITAADAPTGGNVTSGGFGTALIDCENAPSVFLRATCNTASAQLAGWLVYYDPSGNCIGRSLGITFNSDATLRLGNGSGDFIAYCSDEQLPIGAVRQVKLFVNSLTAATTWAVGVTPFS